MFQYVGKTATGGRCYKAGRAERGGESTGPPDRRLRQHYSTQEVIVRCLTFRDTMTLADLTKCFEGAGFSAKGLGTILNRLITTGVIFSPARGVYSLHADAGSRKLRQHGDRRQLVREYLSGHKTARYADIERYVQSKESDASPIRPIIDSMLKDRQLFKVEPGVYSLTAEHPDYQRSLTFKDHVLRYLKERGESSFSDIKSHMQTLGYAASAPRVSTVLSGLLRAGRIVTVGKNTYKLKKLT